MSPPSAFSKIPESATKTIQATPFKLAVQDSKLADLKTLLRLSPVAGPTYESSQQDIRKFGVTIEWVRKAKDKWLNEFDWRAHEERINSFPQFTAPVVDDDGRVYTIHFVGIFSEKVDAVPVVFLHGWPGSFLEFLPAITLLTEQHTPATLPYHIIVPTLPGWTLSSKPPVDKDFTSQDVARLFDRLLIGLGFGAGYVAQGGDIGASVGRNLAAHYPTCKVNYCIIPTEPAGVDQSSLTDWDRRGLAQSQKFMTSENAYALEQAYKPSTIGIVLSSSPVALLAWFGEKFLAWVDEPLPLDTILEAVTLYWVTDSMATSIYTYREYFQPGHPGSHEHPDWFVAKPLGFSSYPEEIAIPPKSWVEKTGNLVFYREHDKGGHFAALERTDQFVKDIEDFVKQVWVP
ncbi:hypothetical protein PLICRDRAFT_49516 [Plicaturopsis crispa FD-325 SS-3]|nr:hypothetical protein PLICRDRAFT_49516 [Plicaturopsis crispa FD-325 SS-3]